MTSMKSQEMQKKIETANLNRIFFEKIKKTYILVGGLPGESKTPSNQHQ